MASSKLYNATVESVKPFLVRENWCSDRRALTDMFYRYGILWGSKKQFYELANSLQIQFGYDDDDL